MRVISMEEREGSFVSSLEAMHLSVQLLNFESDPSKNSSSSKIGLFTTVVLSKFDSCVWQIIQQGYHRKRYPQVSFLRVPIFKEDLLVFLPDLISMMLSKFESLIIFYSTITIDYLFTQIMFLINSQIPRAYLKELFRLVLKKLTNKKEWF